MTSLQPVTVTKMSPMRAADALAAPAVARDDNRLAGDNQVGGIHDRGPDRLAGAVFVVVIVLGLCVIDGHHRAGEDTLALTRPQAVDSGRGLFTAADEIVGAVPAAASQQIDQIASVIHDEVRMAGKGRRQQIFIFLW